MTRYIIPTVALLCGACQTVPTYDYYGGAAAPILYVPELYTPYSQYYQPAPQFVPIPSYQPHPTDGLMPFIAAPVPGTW